MVLTIRFARLIFVALSLMAAVSVYSLPAEAQKNSPAAVFKEARKLARSGRYDRAIDLVQKNFKLSNPRTPFVVLTSVCLWGTRIGQYKVAAMASEAAVRGHISWWPEYIKTATDETVDVSGYLENTKKNQLVLLGCFGEAQSQFFKAEYENLSEEKRKRLKHQVKKTYDFLIQSNFPSEKSEAFNSRMAEAEDAAIKKVKKFFLDFSGQLLFWRSKFDYSGASSGEGTALVQAVCPGVQAGYRSFYTEYSLGACLGYGKARLDFRGAAFESGADAMAIDVNALAMRYMSENRIGLGFELNAMIPQVKSAGVDGYNSKEITDINLGWLIVSRLKFDSFTFDVKGGRILDQRSGFWGLGFTLPL